VGSNPTVCAKDSTLRGAAFYFCGKLCKGCKVGFEQPVPGALRPAGQKCPGGAFLGRGRVRASAPKAAPCGALLFIFAANYARAARWDSNSPCPALCAPPGCNSPADCCKGAGESARLRQKQHLEGCCFLFLQQTMQGLQGGIRTARARRFASRLAKMPRWGIFRARESPTVCAKYHYSILHWVVIFYC